MIKLNQVSKVYPDGTQAVKNISFEVEEGELCVLLGPSGCGKTTTMKMINRLIPITEGEIYIDGRKNTELNEDELRRNIGYAIQDIGLFPHMTVQQNIETVPVLKSWPKTERSKRAEELLELMGMPAGEYMNKYPSELSGGQMQRVAIARALVNEPAIILADEPTGNLDSKSGVEIMQVLQRLNTEKGITIICVTHDPWIARHSGRVIRLADGLVVGDETIDEPLIAGETDRPSEEVLVHTA